MPTRTTLALALAAAAVALPSAGCGGSGKEEEWLGPRSHDKNGAVPVAEFNRFLDESEEQVGRTVLRLTITFLGIEGAEAETTSVIVRARQTPGAGARVTATLDGLADDSVRGIRYVLQLRRKNDEWRLASARWARRCQLGRGHADYSVKTCL